MKYLIDDKIKTPLYIQLYVQVRDDIINGIYPLNSKPSSKRTISYDTGFSTVTVEHVSRPFPPSFRIGYMVLPKDLVKKYDRKLSFLSCTVPTYIQYVMAELLTN